MPAASDFSTLGIVFALDMEARGLRRILAQSRRVRAKYDTQSAWQVGTTRVLVTISGMGREKCAKATESLIESGARWIVNAGFAAALDDKAGVGDVVVANRLLLHGIDCAHLFCSESLMAAIPPSGRLGYSVWRSDLVTCDEMVLQSEQKHDIYASTGAAALDMECYAAAEICEERRVPFASIKGVSDVASESLPEEFAALSQIKGRVGLFAFILARPHLWRSLLRIRKNALKAADNLGDVLGMMLLRLSGI